MRCLWSQFAGLSRLLPAEVKKIPQRLEVLELAAQFRNTTEAFGRIKHHAIEEIFEHSGNLGAIPLGEMRHRRQTLVQEHLAFGGEFLDRKSVV